MFHSREANAVIDGVIYRIHAAAAFLCSPDITPQLRGRKGNDDFSLCLRVSGISYVLRYARIYASTTGYQGTGCINKEKISLGVSATDACIQEIRFPDTVQHAYTVKASQPRARCFAKFWIARMNLHVMPGT